MQIVCHACGAKNRLDAGAVGRPEMTIQCGRCQTALLDGKPVDLSDGNFQSYVSATQLPLVVDFWAPWCGPCRMVGPIVEEIAQEREDIAVGKINVDEEVELAMEFGVASIPTLVVVEHGEVMNKAIGYMPKAEIEELLG